MSFPSRILPRYRVPHSPRGEWSLSRDGCLVTDLMWAARVFPPCLRYACVAARRGEALILLSFHAVSPRHLPPTIDTAIRDVARDIRWRCDDVTSARAYVLPNSITRRACFISTYKGGATDAYVPNIIINTYVRGHNRACIIGYVNSYNDRPTNIVTCNRFRRITLAWR